MSFYSEMVVGWAEAEMGAMIEAWKGANEQSQHVEFRCFGSVDETTHIKYALW